MKQGLSCIFGDNGFGKSSLLRYIAASYDHDENFRVAMVAEKTNAPQFTFLKAISKELDIAPQRSAVAQMDALEEFLVEQYKEGKTVLVMVDEAQLLRLESMECVRSLLNYETNTEKLCQIVLAGQLELRDRMMTRRYKAFRTRVVAPVVLELFTPEETEAMIMFRHEYWQVRNRFSHEAILRVQELTQGVPRDIVLICGYAYSSAIDNKVEQIGPELVDKAAKNLEMRKDREAAAVVA